MDGLQLLQHVKARDADAAVIMLTGAADVRTAVESLKQGASDFILKPVNLDQVLLSAERALERRQLLIERREHQVLLEYRVAEATRDLATALDELQQTYQTTLEALGSVLATREVGTELHSRRVHALLAGPRPRPRAARGRARRAGPRRAPPRHRQDRHLRRDPAQARTADARGVGDHAEPSGDRPADPRAHPVPPRRDPGGATTTTSAGTAPAIRSGSRAPPSRSAPASSRWPTPSTR